MSSGGTGCTLFDAHIKLIFSRQYYFITSIVVPYKTRTISYMHIFSIFGRLYHFNSETDMHIFLIFSRKYQINWHIHVYAFAPGRVLF